VLTFSQAQLVGELEQLPARMRTIFAAGCAERILPAYERFSRRTGLGDDVALQGVLARLWADLAGDRMSKIESESGVSMCRRLSADAEDHVADQVAAEDAAAAVAYALACGLNGRAEDAGWAGCRAYEAVFAFVIRNECIDVNTPYGKRVARGEHPLLQAELVRQRRDIDELLLHGASETEMAGVVRRRSQDERNLALPFSETQRGGLEA